MGPVPEKILHESWNAFSRIMVTPFPENYPPFGWGIDKDHLTRFEKVKQLYLEIDSGAATPLTHFDGTFRKLEFLKYDITSFAHYLRSNGDVFIIGAGGGRDILTALVFNQRSIVAVEVNQNIVNCVNNIFGDFTGHLDRLPNVRFIVDEARSYLSRTKNKFDIIQASFVDTVAATASGAYAFIENGLYTIEAWELFLNRLKPDGMLTFSRFYYVVST